MVIQLTAGQMCLLRLMQQKLLGTLKLYAQLRMEEKEATPGSLQQRAIVGELNRLRDKIKRISARQKRFTSEIINGNGINTIPKESYFKALGLVTKETLSQLNSKSSERRRRTTANPRFSHEAIQAKKALQKPRIETRVTREKRGAESTRNNTPSASQRVSAATTNNNNNSIRNIGGKSAQHKPSNHINNEDPLSTGAQAATATRASQRNGNASRSNASSRQSSDPGTGLSLVERHILYEKFKALQRQLESKANSIKDKMHNIKRVEDDNLRILNEMDRAHLELAASGEDEVEYRGIKEALDRAARNIDSFRLLLENGRAKPSLEYLRGKLDDDPGHQGDALMRSIEAYFKCEESLDGID